MTKPLEQFNTCICSKILEHVVHSAISEQLEDHQTLSDERHKRSCETQLISTVNDFAKCLNQGGQCNILLLDFSKAFNKSLTHSCITSYRITEYKGHYYLG